MGKFITVPTPKPKKKAGGKSNPLADQIAALVDSVFGKPKKKPDGSVNRRKLLGIGILAGVVMLIAMVLIIVSTSKRRFIIRFKENGKPYQVKVSAKDEKEARAFFQRENPNADIVEVKDN